MFGSHIKDCDLKLRERFLSATTRSESLCLALVRARHLRRAGCILYNKKFAARKVIVWAAIALAPSSHLGITHSRFSPLYTSRALILTVLRFATFSARCRLWSNICERGLLFSRKKQSHVRQGARTWIHLSAESGKKLIALCWFIFGKAREETKSTPRWRVLCNRIFSYRRSAYFWETCVYMCVCSRTKRGFEKRQLLGPKRRYECEIDLSSAFAGCGRVGDSIFMRNLLNNHSAAFWFNFFLQSFDDYFCIILFIFLFCVFCNQ